MSELAYDVRKTLHELGESVRVTDEEHADASTLLQDDTDARTDTILRAITRGWGAVRAAVSGYLVEDEHYADNILPQLTRAKEELTLTFTHAGSDVQTTETEDNTLIMLLRVTSNARTSVRESVAQLTHDALVCSAVSDVLMTTAYADRATAYAQRASDDIASLDALLCARQRPTRTHLPAPDAPHTNDMRYE